MLFFPSSPFFFFGFSLFSFCFAFFSFVLCLHHFIILIFLFLFFSDFFFLSFFFLFRCVLYSLEIAFRLSDVSASASRNFVTLFETTLQIWQRERNPNRKSIKKSSFPFKRTLNLTLRNQGEHLQNLNVYDYKTNRENTTNIPNLNVPFAGNFPTFVPNKRNINLLWRVVFYASLKINRFFYDYNIRYRNQYVL